jgi:5-methylcytosine-specific restriction endonuclease McrA
VSLLFPKGPTHKQQKAVRQHQEKLDRCEGERCFARLKRAHEPGSTEFNAGHVHEIVLRSHGGNPTDPANCRLLCWRCHPEVHGLAVAR